MNKPWKMPMLHLPRWRRRWTNLARNSSSNINALAGQAPIDFHDVMLEHNYDRVQAYCQGKLTLVMFTFDLAEELAGTGVTANCLHPATYMPTKMVLA